jgi:murein DD-endopeptidase MepM/ murein hydrolase activator NlpD
LPDFRELMTLILLSSMSGSFGGSASGSGASGMSMNNLLAPLMITLLEKLMAQQVESASTEEMATPVNTPQGMPIEGHLTQNSHSGHVALDFGAPVGTPVQATMDGEVVYAGWNDQGYGNLVIIENGPYRVYFAHLSEIPVRVGQRVRAGEVIALSGNTGNSTGPHLHYEVRLNGRQVNPAKFTLP